MTKAEEEFLLYFENETVCPERKQIKISSSILRGIVDQQHISGSDRACLLQNTLGREHDSSEWVSWKWKNMWSAAKMTKCWNHWFSKKSMSRTTFLKTISFNHDFDMEELSKWIWLFQRCDLRSFRYEICHFINGYTLDGHFQKHTEIIRGFSIAIFLYPMT